MNPASVAMLSAKDVRQGYGSRDVISSFTYDFSAGVTGVLGPNGAGKSTLLATLGLLRRPRRGQIMLLGEPVQRTRDLRRAKREIGYLPQGFTYPGSLTVEQFLHQAAWLREVPRHARGAAVARALEALDLGVCRRQRMRTLSGGTLQRAGIAQAVIHRPSVLVLDEPTVGLDPEQRAHFHEMLARVAADSCVVLSTHLVDDVLLLANRVLVVVDGELRMAGSIWDLAIAGGAAAAGAELHARDVEKGYLALLSGIRGVVT